jgi:hypothetical protein
LVYLLNKKISGIALKKLLIPLAKILLAAAVTGGVMFLLLKLFDRSVWDKNLSFLGPLGLTLPTNFENFVLDTRYTVNLIYLTAIVSGVGVAVYILAAWLLRIEELAIFGRFFRRLENILPPVFRAKGPREKEAITIDPEQSQSV